MQTDIMKAVIEGKTNNSVLFPLKLILSLDKLNLDRLNTANNIETPISAIIKKYVVE